jgi:hypothetical protein
MPAIASLEDLNEVLSRLNALKERFPEAYDEFARLFRAYRRIGYKNICKLLLGEATPEKLKGEQ